MTDLTLDPFDARWLNCLYAGKLAGLVKSVETTAILIEPLIEITLFNGSKAKEFFSLKANCESESIKKDDYVIFEWKVVGEKSAYQEKRNINIYNVLTTKRMLPEALNTEIVPEAVAKELTDRFKMLLPDEIRNQWSKYLKQIEQLGQKENELKKREDFISQEVEKLVSERTIEILQKVDIEKQQAMIEQERLSDFQNHLNRRQKELEPYRLAIPIKNREQNAASTSNSPKNLGENWQKQLQQDGLQVSKNIANSFLVSLLSGFYSGGLVLLNGSVGVGKTSIVKHSAKILGGSYEIIPVRPAWIEPADLLGFFDPISEIFRPTSFLTALKKAEEDSEKLHLICLDELNLAKIENYASDLLSKLEYSRDLPKTENNDSDSLSELESSRESDESSKKGLLLFADEIETELFDEMRFLREQKDLDSKQKVRLNRLQMFLPKQRSRQSIPQNMVLLGTLNSDETTYDLSPKVIDRSFTITYPLADFNEISKQERDLHDSFDTFSIPKLREALNKEYVKNYDNLTNKKSNEWNKIQHWQKDYFSEESPLGIPLGYRTMKEYAVFYSVANRLGFSPQEAFSHFVFAKILPRISFFKADKLNQLFRKLLTELKQDHKKYDPANIIGKLERQLDDERRQTVRYWG